MPPHTRSQRRRQPAKQQPRQRTERNDTVNDAIVEVDDLNPTLASPAAQATLPALQEVPVGAPVRAETARAASATTRRSNPAASSSANARRRARPELAPVDYASDYRSVRHDLRWIGIWTVLLFVAMVALHLSGIAL